MRFRIDGLDCPVCAEEIQNALQREPGLEEVTVNYAAATIDVPPEHIERASLVVQGVDPSLRLVPMDKPDPRSGREHDDILRGRLYHYVRVGVAGTLFAFGWLPGYVLNLAPHWGTMLFLLAYIVSGYPVIRSAFNSIRNRMVFDEHVLMSIATAGALGLGEYPEAAAVMVFFCVGETLQSVAVDRSRKAVTSLMELSPETARTWDGANAASIPVEHVKPGQHIRIYAGERIPLDGEIIEGDSDIDTSALTGESIPRPVAKGDEIHGGSVNVSGTLTARVTRGHDSSAMARILHLVTEAASRRAPVERFLTRFARWYTPTVVLAAIALAVLPPLILPAHDFATWAYRALVLLVISCPCALVVSIPLGYFAGIGLSSRNGFLVKGANTLDALVDVRTVVMDKTGTLTDGKMKVLEITGTAEYPEDSVLKLAVQAEDQSTHPIARAILEHVPAHANNAPTGFSKEKPGRGVVHEGPMGRILVGNSRLLHEEGISVPDAESATVFVAHDGQLAGSILLGERPRPEARMVVSSLRDLGIDRIVMLTGDDAAPARSLAKTVGIDEYRANLLPEDKVRHVDEISDESPGGVLFVGDGINDAPVLTAADVGVALGGLGSDAAIEVSDMVIMDDRLDRLPAALAIARKTRGRVVQNTVGALTLKVVFLALGALGMAGIWAAVFADVGVTLLAILNSASLLLVNRKSGWIVPSLPRDP